MIETAKMSERGQIVIPKEIRDFIHADEGTLFTLFPLNGETIIMKKMDTAAMVKEFRKIRASVKEHMTNDEINEVIAEARREQRQKGRR
jgi:AbrB family looped-hinge helix DNA binding protein